MKNYKTTLGGILAATGTAMQISNAATLKLIGAIIGGLGLILLGTAAKDHNVTGK